MFDNDAAGRDAEEKVKSLDLPPTLRIVRLPNLVSCESFPTDGPTGRVTQDINGRAVSTELFLDLRSGPSPVVRWTSYNQHLACYQGELIGKELYVKEFLRTKGRVSDYDYSELELLLDHLYAEIVRDDGPNG